MAMRRRLAFSNAIDVNACCHLAFLVAVLSMSASGPVRAEGPKKKLENLWTRQAGQDWPDFLGPGREGKSSEQGIWKAWEQRKPRIVWQRELGEGYAIGSISLGRFFQFDRVGNEARVVCLNAETGKQIWEHRYPTNYSDLYGYDGGPRCSPMVEGNRVYTYGAGGMLLCLNARDGVVRWKNDTVKQFKVVQNFFGVGSTPVIFENLLLVMVGGSPPEDSTLPPGQLNRVRGNGSAIVAFDKLTGEVRYKISDELASYVSPRIDWIDGRPWCFSLCRGGLLAFDPRNGKRDFHFPWRARLMESVMVSVPVVHGNEVLITETYGPGSCLLKIGPTGHEVLWQDDVRKREKAFQGHMMTPILVDGFLYGCSGRNPPVDVRCVEWKTGKVTWKLGNQYRSSLLYVDGHFVSLDENGRLQLLKVDPKAYTKVAEWHLGAQDSLGKNKNLKYPCWAAPILSHGLLYLRGKDRVVCLELISDR